MKYSASFKLQVVKFASDNSNNSAASRKFGIDEKLVRDRGRKCQWPELEKKVVEWVEENRKSGLAVTKFIALTLSLNSRSSVYFI